jgi:hypothetical protein
MSDAQPTDLHARLIQRFTTQELARKAIKAINRARIWSWEELDLCERRAHEIASRFKETAQ